MVSLLSAPLLMILLAGAIMPSELDRCFQAQCQGLEAYDIRGSYHVDFGGGTIRSKQHDVSFVFSMGTVRSVAPSARPPGFRWYKEESLSTATIRYGLKVREKQLQATIIGAPLSYRLNVFGAPGTEEEFLALLRTLAMARCATTRIDCAGGKGQ